MLCHDGRLKVNERGDALQKPEAFGYPDDTPESYVISGLNPGENATDIACKALFKAYVAIQADKPNGISAAEAAWRCPAVFGGPLVTIALTCHHGELVKAHGIGSHTPAWSQLTRAESVAVSRQLRENRCFLKSLK